MATTRGGGGKQRGRVRPQTAKAAPKPKVAKPATATGYMAKGMSSFANPAKMARSMGVKPGGVVGGPANAFGKAVSGIARGVGDVAGAAGRFIAEHNAEMTGQTPSTISRAMQAAPQARKAIRKAGGGR